MTSRVVLLGDSHLARVRRDLPRIAPDVLNAAVGGSTVRDLPRQIAPLDLGPDDAVVVSIGTNDAAWWRELPLEEYAARLATVLAGLSVGRLVHLASPGVRDDHPEISLNPTIAHYRTAGARLFAEAGAQVIDTPALLADLGRAAYVDDGIHLTGQAYDVVLPAIAAALASD